MLTLPHISVCICTYKRPDLLKRLLDALREQETGGLFTYSIVVVDNDALQSAKDAVHAFSATASIPITYCVEAQQSIALARNKAIEHASGDYVALIDDDEFPITHWLSILFNTCNKHHVDGVLGPVKPHYDVSPPQWVLDGHFHQRATYPTGYVIAWRNGRTGNTFLRKAVFAACTEQPFNPEFRTGEDQEFFYRMIQHGFRFIWCNEALAYEVIPPIRWNRRFMLRRALLRGTLEPKAPTFGSRDIIRSITAVPVYILLLPFALLRGQSWFMTLLIKLCDHLGKLCALVGISTVTDPYVTE
ncbi:MAG: glycosyltransferase family 2 protein [Bryobacterales bacterium]|nr:glycosyltransferase family 2 protein [Bryobacterales bacterium]